MKLWKKIALASWLGLGIFSAIGSSLQINNNSNDFIGAVYRLNPFTKKLDKVNTSTDFVNDFLYKPGLAGGQTAYGSDTTGENLTFYSNTSHDGLINLGDFLEVDEANLGVTVGGTYTDTDQDPNIPFSVIKTIDDYSGINVFNRSSGTSAQANVVVVNDSATGYGALGINGSNFSVVDQALYTPGSVFLESGDTNLYVGSGGTTSSTGNTIIYAGGRTTTENTSIFASWENKVGIGQVKADQDLDIAGHLSFQQIANPVNISTAALAGVGAGSVDNGVHRYKYVYVAPVGDTGVSSLYSEVTVVDKTTDGKVQLSNIPQSTDQRVTNIRIYRTKVSGTVAYYLVTTITAGTTAYLDNATDASLGTTDWRNKENTTGGRLYLNGIIGTGRFGIYNTALGYLSLNSLTNGYLNFAFGNSALRFITSGGNNLAMGAYAVENGTSASNIVALGYNAFNSTITSGVGVAIGSQSGQTATNITGAVLVGYQTAVDATDLSYDTLAGYRTGYYPNGVLANKATTSTYNTWIGGQTGLASPTQRTKTIALGWNSVVDADNTAVIGGTGADAVNTVFGGTTARGKIDVLGDAYFGGLTHYSYFETDGTYTMAGSSSVWNDVQYVISTGKVPAANFPDYNPMIGNLEEYQFAVGDFIGLGSQEFPHWWKEGSPIELHVHWATGNIATTTDSRYVKWELEYSCANTGNATPFPTPTVSSAETQIPTSTPPITHLYTSIINFTPTVSCNQIGAQMKMRLRRIASAGTAPVADPFALQVGIHAEEDTIGSRTISTK